MWTFNTMPCTTAFAIMRALLTALLILAATVHLVYAQGASNTLSPVLPSAPTTTAGLAAGQKACSQLQTILGSKYASILNQSLKYGQSRLYWNSRQDYYTPTCAIYPTTAGDVSNALKIIKASKSRFAIKAGGHNPNDFFASVNNGVLIDLVSMNNLSYDAVSQTITYGPGNRFQDIYKFGQQYGVTVAGARLGEVGSGLALGGGLSYLSGQYGMAADGFRSLTVVLPNGTISEVSASSHPDLFLAMKGGGGNPYGVVTQYTVAARKIDSKIFAGNIIYALNYSQQVLDAARDFSLYNTDPKAATITTFLEVPLPDLFINLSEVALIFLVYDGQDPGQAFKNFTDIPHLLDTTRLMSYYDATQLPAPGTLQLSQGANKFRVSTYTLEDGGQALSAAYRSYKDWSTKNKASYLVTSFDVEPVPQSLLDASTAQGGNAMDMKQLKGPFVWVNWLLTTSPLITDAQYNAIQASFKQAQEAVPSAKGYPLFINDAAYDQNALATYKTYTKLQAIKKQVDPDNFFGNYTGGWSFTAPADFE
jgi:FAD/FMN-containing dehydrogenase